LVDWFIVSWIFGVEIEVVVRLCDDKESVKVICSDVLLAFEVDWWFNAFKIFSTFKFDLYTGLWISCGIYCFLKTSSGIYLSSSSELFSSSLIYKDVE